MNCPRCQSNNYIKKGKTKNGIYNRYKCKDCDKNWSDSPLTRGKKPIGLVAMSNAERQRKYREKSKEQNFVN